MKTLSERSRAARRNRRWMWDAKMKPQPQAEMSRYIVFGLNGGDNIVVSRRRTPPLLKQRLPANETLHTRAFSAQQRVQERRQQLLRPHLRSLENARSADGSNSESSPQAPTLMAASTLQQGSIASSSKYTPALHMSGLPLTSSVCRLQASASHGPSTWRALASAQAQANGRGLRDSTYGGVRLRETAAAETELAHATEREVAVENALPAYSAGREGVQRERRGGGVPALQISGAGKVTGLPAVNTFCTCAACNSRGRGSTAMQLQLRSTVCSACASLTRGRGRRWAAAVPSCVVMQGR